MKVPQYRSKMPLPKRTGAGTLTAQASPGIWGLPGAAQQEFGKTVATEGQMWGTFLLKTERATEQAKHEKKVDDLISQAKINAAMQMPDDWKDPTDPLANSADPEERATARTMGYQARQKLVREQLEAAASRQLNNITDRVVRSRMASSIQTKLTAAMSNIQPILQRHYLDYAKTEILKSNKANINRISMMSEGKGKEDAIEDAQKRVEYFKELYPLISKEWVWKSQENFNSDLGAHTLRRAFTQIKKEEDAVAWLDQLSDPQKGSTVPESHYNDVKRLTDKQRTTFIERLQKTAARLSAAESSAANTKIKLDAWKRTQTKKATYERMSSNALKMIAAELKGHDANDPEWPKDSLGNPLKPQTAFDVLAIPPSDLDANQRTALLNIINQKDLEVDSKAFYRHSTEIREAFNEEELRLVELSIEAKRNNRTMSYGTYDSLRTLLNNRRDKTPGYKEQEVYGKLLNEIMNKAGVTVTPFTKVVGTDPTDKAVQGDQTSVLAKIKFSELIQRGARPVEAFYETIETFVNDQNKLAGNIFKLLDKDMLAGTGPGDDVIKDVSKLTDEHVNIIRENFLAHARGRKVAQKIKPLEEITVDLSKTEMAKLQRDKTITFDQRKTMRELIKIEQAIDYLQQYANRPKAPPPPPVVHEKEDTKGVLDRAQDWVEGWFAPKPGGRVDRSGESFSAGGGG